MSNENLGIQIAPKYAPSRIVASTAHPSDPNAVINHPHSYSANTKPIHPDWDEEQYQRTWGQHDMSGEPDIPVARYTSPKTVGTRRPLDSDD